MDRILSAFRVLSPISYSCHDQVVQTRTDGLVASLQECLYRSCYTRPFDGTLREAVPSRDPDEHLVQELQTANSSKPVRQRGWEIEQLDGSGRILAARNGVLRWFLPGRYLTVKGPGFVAEAGDAVEIWAPPESTAEQKSFYMSFGETVSHEEEHLDLLRFYWNVSDRGAVGLMASLTAALNRFAVPFLLKCGNRREMFDRVDAAVLYINKRYYRIATEVIVPVYHTMAGMMEPDTPLFTKRLAPGLALAEDPTDGLSFGMNRCKILADALLSCHQQGLESEADRRAELEKQFRDRGLRLEQAYLNAGSTDRYEFSL